MVFLMAHLSPQLVPSVSPSGVRVERLNSTAINVSWTLLTLEEARGFVTSYTVSYSKGEGQGRRPVEELVVPGGEQSSAVIGGLDTGSSYLLSVSAGTSAGSGQMSEPVVLARDSTASTEQVIILVCFFYYEAHKFNNLQEYNIAGFGHGFAAGLVSGVLILCGLVGLVAAVMFLVVKRRRQKTSILHR